VHIGRLLGALDDLGVASRALVFLSSDNGPEIRREQLAMSGWALNLSGRKHYLFDGETRFVFTVRWPGHTPSGNVSDDPRDSTVDLVPTSRQQPASRCR
jgi:arylsulfatase A-like enzyme